MNEPIFIPAPFFFLRAPYGSIEDAIATLKDEQWIDRVFHFYETDLVFQEAIAIASPSLHRALQKKDAERTEAVAISLLRYALRMKTRAIPFGLFSFVATGSWGQKTDLFLDLTKVGKRARPDMSWVYALIQKLYKDEKVFLSLPVRTNPLVTQNGERFFLSYIRKTDKEDPTPPRKFSIRVSKLTRAILNLAKQPTEIGILCDRLLTSIPGLDRQKVIEVIRNLFSEQFLLSSLVPSLLSFSPFEDLLPQLAPFISMDEIAQKIDQYNAAPLGEGGSLLGELHRAMEEVAPVKTFLQVDTVYEGPSLVLSRNISEEMGRAAEILWKISPPRSLPPPLKAYHARFLEKYGTHRTVPLMELLSEEMGLGPFDLEQTANFENQTANFTKEWEKWLSEKWQQCLYEKTSEIVFDEKTVERFFRLAEQKTHDPQDALLSMDLFCTVIAESSEEIDRGNFLLQFIQPTWQGGNSMGRFLDLLEEKAQARFQSMIHAEEALEKDSLFVETSYWPLSGYNANVSTQPCFRKYRLDLESKHMGPETLSLEDIYVGATLDRFYLTLKEGEKEVITRVGNLLNPLLAPVPLQFLRAATLAKYQLLEPFSWGPLKQDAVFLPRVRFERTILSPMQWKLRPNAFSKEQQENMASAFTVWADQWALPKYCFLVEGDQRLLIDRSHPAHLREIVLKLKKGEPLRFFEYIGSQWIESEKGHHLCEVIIPFLKNPAYSSKQPFHSLGYSPIPIESRIKLLGSEWLFVKIYLEDEGAVRFLTQHLSPFAEKLHAEGRIAGWFFIQYRDPDYHLRFRVRLTDPASMAPILFMLQELSLHWIQVGLIKNMVFAQYEREVERYGGLKLIEAAEAVFCADSVAVVHILQSISNRTAELTEPVLHALSVICFLKDFDLSQSQILDLLKLENEKGSALEGFREHKGHLVGLIEKLEANSPIRDLGPILEASRLRQETQKAFKAQADQIFSNPSFETYNSMLHMHCNRLGCDHSTEQRARLYARHALLQVERRRGLCPS